MTRTSQLQMMAEIDAALSSRGAGAVDLVDVAGRLLSSAFRSISEQNPGVDVASLLGRTLELLRADVLSALQGPGPDDIMS